MRKRKRERDSDREIECYWLLYICVWCNVFDGLHFALCPFWQTMTRVSVRSAKFSNALKTVQKIHFIFVFAFQPFGALPVPFIPYRLDWIQSQIESNILREMFIFRRMKLFLIFFFLSFFFFSSFFSNGDAADTFSWLARPWKWCNILSTEIEMNNLVDLTIFRYFVSRLSHLYRAYQKTKNRLSPKKKHMI